MNSRTATTITVYGALAAIAVGSFLLPSTLTIPITTASSPPDEIHLVGLIRDFRVAHPDFGIVDPAALGHAAWNVGPILAPDRRPMFGGGGLRIVTEWEDKDGNPIAPYSGDPGLPGGHFDVDVFDEASTSEVYHKHEFDDTYDVSYVDVVHDTNLLFDSIVGAGYPNDLRVEFLNVHNGVGFFTFQAGVDYEVGSTLDGFDRTFNPADLTQLRVDFVSLHGLQATDPGNAQGDMVDRDDSFAVRMYDSTTSELVYELVVYHHGDGVMDPGGGSGMSGSDACGDSYDDTVGMFGTADDGAIQGSQSFDQWFHDYLGTNVSTTHTTVLTRNVTGVYEYLTDQFYPIDGQLLGDEGESHNNFFTYSISALFTYESCTGQFFEFEGNDDCWVFVDGTRVIDLGGAGNRLKQYVAMDRVGLVDGDLCRLDFFFAHRHQTADSVFRMRTNIPLINSIRPMSTAAFD